MDDVAKIISIRSDYENVDIDYIDCDGKMKMKTVVPEDELLDYVKRLQREIVIKDAYLKSIVVIGYDYDGYSTVNDLKDLIDELLEIAEKGMKCDDKSVFYSSEDANYNILMEELCDEEDRQTYKD